MIIHNSKILFTDVKCVSLCEGKERIKKITVSLQGKTLLFAEVLIADTALIRQSVCFRRLYNINPLPRLQMHLKEGDKHDISRTS